MTKALGILLAATLLILKPAGPRRDRGPLENRSMSRARESQPRRYFLGFDRDVYPGDAALPILRRTFSFSSFWLNRPPGEKSDTWGGKRHILLRNGFGFLVLFNGRLDDELKGVRDARALGKQDAAEALRAARREGFSEGTVIFLDQEEGGRLLPEQKEYLFAWVDGVTAARYRAGVYCSGIPAVDPDERGLITAKDIRDNARGRRIVFWVYNDTCPPSRGCVFPGNPPPPSESGVPFASVWQFAQSPRKAERTRACPSLYAADGNCYPPLLRGNDRPHLDLDTASSPDPSGGRRSSPLKGR